MEYETLRNLAWRQIPVPVENVTYRRALDYVAGKGERPSEAELDRIWWTRLMSPWNIYKDQVIELLKEIQAKEKS